MTLRQLIMFAQRMRADAPNLADYEIVLILDGDEENPIRARNLILDIDRNQIHMISELDMPDQEEDEDDLDRGDHHDEDDPDDDNR